MNKISWQTLSRLKDLHGASFFVFDEVKFKNNFMNLKSDFRRHYDAVEIGYSYKTNYTPYICSMVRDLGGHAEVVSEMEFDLARRLDVPGNRIIFNGPYKSERAFREALLCGAIVNLDSGRDITMLKQIAFEHPNQKFEVALRCNFELTAGQVSRFGFDVEGPEFQEVIGYLKSAINVDLSGLHCHFPDRDLQSFDRRALKLLELSNKLFDKDPPKFLNIGGGYFSSMPDTLRQLFDAQPASFEDYGSVIGQRFAKNFADCVKKPTLFIEPGTALVADTFKFYTQVISTKTIRSHNFATVAGSIFDFSASARAQNLPVSVINQTPGAVAAREWDVAGFTCIEGDLLSRSMNAQLEVDDFVSFENVGSYSIVMKPPFILPANSVLVLTGESEFRLIKKRESNSQVFENFELTIP